MDVRNCKSCGRIFNYLSGAPLCPGCLKILEDKFDKVKEFVYKNPNVGISEVAEAGEVSVSQINQWIRDERLSFSENSDIGIDCESCGTTIRTGRFCKSCKNGLTRDLQSAYPTRPAANTYQTTDEKSKMRFLDK
ncbi:MAG TPA: flagellar protein [Clostridiales bacterium]|nr:flagellar protein [Clostridiales bacterium]